MSVSAADRHYNATERAREVLLNSGGVANSPGGVANVVGGVAFNLSDFDTIRREVFDDTDNFVYSYFMKACKFRLLYTETPRP